MKKRTLVFVLAMLAVLALAACSASADSADCNDLAAGQTIKVEGAWSRTTAMHGMDAGMDMGKNSAAYMVIHNCGADADSLSGAMSSVSEMTTLMNTEIKDGTARMFDVPQIDVPAGKKVE